jgi:hypothetical protein
LLFCDNLLHWVSLFIANQATLLPTSQIKFTGFSIQGVWEAVQIIKAAGACKIFHRALIPPVIASILPSCVNVSSPCCIPVAISVPPLKRFQIPVIHPSKTEKKALVIAFPTSEAKSVVHFSLSLL